MDINYKGKLEIYDYNLKKKSNRNQVANINGKLKYIENKHTSSKIKDIICFSHLRWNFVFQRPQHLLLRWAKETRVFYFEEPVFGNYSSNSLSISTCAESENIIVLTPNIKQGYSEKEIYQYQKELITSIIIKFKIRDYLLWYLTPMAMPFSSGLSPKIVVYDCMDELSCFKGAHPDMLKNEALLLQYADVVFTGGYSLYEYKKDKHLNIHPFPSSIDQRHFESGLGNRDPEDQSYIPHPRVGFFGVIDERMDITLLNNLALCMPEVQFILIGPIVKINPADLPRYKNIHYLGQKDYNDLPRYLANWDLAFLPFAKNDSTRFISPTKTPEYLSAGKPVISTSIRDVVIPYGELGFVHIADKVSDFSKAIGKALKQVEDEVWRTRVKEFLKCNSWDNTWKNMKKIIFDTLIKKETRLQIPLPALSKKLNGTNRLSAENL